MESCVDDVPLSGSTTVDADMHCDGKHITLVSDRDTYLTNLFAFIQSKLIS